jgi:hypothetical protein
MGMDRNHNKLNAGLEGAGGGESKEIRVWSDGEFYFKLLKADWMSVSQPLRQGISECEWNGMRDLLHKSSRLMGERGRVWTGS